MPAVVFGNSIEAGGAFQITTANGGAATLVKIETRLFVKNNVNAWVAVGVAKLATVTGTTWSTTRYSQLADGEYKVEATLEYTQTNPVPIGANPQKQTSNFTHTFLKPAQGWWSN